MKISIVSGREALSGMTFLSGGDFRDYIGRNVDIIPRYKTSRIQNTGDFVVRARDMRSDTRSSGREISQHGGGAN